MMDARWIIVRDRQAGLLAEAEAERLARLVRGADAEQEAAEPSTTRFDAMGARVSGRLAPAGALPATEPRVVSTECQKA